MMQWMFTVHFDSPEGSAARAATMKAVWKESAFKAISRVKIKRMKDIPWDNDPTFNCRSHSVKYEFSLSSSPI